MIAGTVIAQSTIRNVHWSRCTLKKTCTEIHKKKNKTRINKFRINILPVIELVNCELGILTGCEEFCKRPDEARPADIEFSK